MEGSSGFNDLELLEAVELIESQKMSEKPADETDAVTYHGTPAPGLNSVEKPEGRERFPVGCAGRWTRNLLGPQVASPTR